MRSLKENIEQNHYFESTGVIASDEGQRDLKPLYPFIISGGENTERYYFEHISKLTKYKFNIVPKFFSDESSYTEVFTLRIEKILKENNDALIYAVYDVDTVFNDKSPKKILQAKNKDFEKKYKGNKSVILCPSMPSIEYWFLLHFKNITKLIKTCGDVCGLMANYMKFCFENPEIIFSKLIKQKKHLTNPSWVANLCADGKLELAIKRAEENIKKAIETNDLNNQSFTFVYRIFKEYTE